MSRVIRCPHCGGIASVYASMAGVPAVCPHCYGYLGVVVRPSSVPPPLPPSREPEKKESVLRRPLPPVVTATLSGIVLVGLMVVFCSGVASPNRSGTPTESGGTSKVTFAGDRAVLSNANGQIVTLAATRVTRDRLVTLATANDRFGVAEMLLDGTAWTVPNGTGCLVIESDYSVSEVRILDGIHAGRAGFVASEFVKKR